MAQKRRATDVPIRSVIPEGVIVSGKMEGNTNILINGKFKGDLLLNGVILVGENGEIEGEVRAKVVAIDGKLDGHVFATQKVEIGASARVKADVHCPVFVMAEQAVFEGSIFSESGGELQPIIFQEKRERRVDLDIPEYEE
jgi:cytoskeletal protein CcmA (bactofilin family)